MGFTCPHWLTRVWTGLLTIALVTLMSWPAAPAIALGGPQPTLNQPAPAFTSANEQRRWRHFPSGLPGQLGGAVLLSPGFHQRLHPRSQAV
jgi:hypothetical protein